MNNPIKVGDTFTTPSGSTFIRLNDDTSPDIPNYERIQLTHLSHPDYKSIGWEPYTFAAEPEWFNQRGLTVKEVCTHNPTQDHCNTYTVFKCIRCRETLYTVFNPYQRPVIYDKARVTI